MLLGSTGSLGPTGPLLCGRIGYTGPTGRTGPSPDPSDPTAYCTHTSLAQLLASSSLLVEVILASSLEPVTN